MSRIFENSYKILFGFSLRKVAVVSLLITIIVSYLKGSFAYIGELLFASSMLYVPKNPLITFRRAFSMSSVLVATIAMLEVVFNQPALSLFLVIPVVTGLILLSINPDSKIYLLPFAFSAVIYLKMSYEASIASIALAAGIPIIRIIFKRISEGLDPFKLFSSFLFAVFGESGEFEAELEKMGEEKELTIRLLRISGRKEHVVVMSQVHPGPFKNVAGAKLIDTISRELSRLGYEATFLHAEGGHENDPVSSREVAKIVDSIITRLGDESFWEEVTPLQPIKSKMGDLAVTYFGFLPRPKIYVISRNKSSMDDIPSKIAEKITTPDTVLIDAQNKFEGEVIWNKEVEEALLGVIKELRSSRVCNNWAIGTAKEYLDDVDPRHEEVGPMGLSAIILKCDSEKSALVVLDSNNMKSSLRQKIENLMESMDYRIAEVATTDNHRMTGGVKGRGYKIAGETINEEVLLERVARALRKAEGNIDASKIEYTELKVKLKVLGESGFERLQRIAMKRKAFATVIFAYVILAALLNVFI